MGEGFTWDTQDRARDIAWARAGWDEVKRMIADPDIAMVVADELNIALRYEYLPVEEVVAGLRNRSAMKHVIVTGRSEEHTSELQSLMRISYAVFCLKKKKNINITYDLCKNACEYIYK